MELHAAYLLKLVNPPDNVQGMLVRQCQVFEREATFVRWQTIPVMPFPKYGLQNVIHLISLYFSEEAHLQGLVISANKVIVLLASINLPDIICLIRAVLL